MSIVIKIDSLSKVYRLGMISSQTIYDDISNFWKRIYKQTKWELISAEANIQEKKSKGQYVWALKDINLEINEGDVLGIIGKNGAGKSTLLKILSRITLPTTGIAKIKGRISSLLEIGTGFHPDLTGRENIFLNGAILGMSKFEIDQQLDEIIDFSGIERYIDTPVKRYSTGMYVRLAFAVAAHLDPDILLIDEVLAVGDADFQDRALGRMEKLSNQRGKTVIMVSHNMSSIKSICTKAIVLENGLLKTNVQSPNEAINNYLGGNWGSIAEFIYDEDKSPRDKDAFIKNAKIMNSNNEMVSEFNTEEDIYIEIFWKKNNNVRVNPNFQLKNRSGIVVMIASDTPIDYKGDKKTNLGNYKSRFKINGNLLNTNDYSITIALDSSSPRSCYDVHFDVLSFSILNPIDHKSNAHGHFKHSRDDAILWPSLECEFHFLD